MSDAPTLVTLTPDHLDMIVALHDFVRESLPPEEKSFILSRARSYFENHFTRGDGNIVIGVFKNDILIGKAVVMHPAADATASDLGGAILSTPPELTSIMQAATVHPAYQGQGVMQLMAHAWMEHAQACGKTHAQAEIEVHNRKSWHTFLKIGLSITRIGRSPIDGAEIYSAQERVKYAMLKELNPEQAIEGEDIAECGTNDLVAQKLLLDQGYAVVAHDRTRGVMFMKRETR